MTVSFLGYYVILGKWMTFLRPDTALLGNHWGLLDCANGGRVGTHSKQALGRGSHDPIAGFVYPRRAGNIKA